MQQREGFKRNRMTKKNVSHLNTLLRIHNRPQNFEPNAWLFLYKLNMHQVVRMGKKNICDPSKSVEIQPYSLEIKGFVVVTHAPNGVWICDLTLHHSYRRKSVIWVSFELELISTNDGKKVFKSQWALTQLCECGARFRMSSWV